MIKAPRFQAPNETQALEPFGALLCNKYLNTQAISVCG